MWVYPCFEGDVDMARAGVQHDLYFPSSSRPYVDIFGGSTLGFIWSNVMLARVHSDHKVYTSFRTHG